MNKFQRFMLYVAFVISCALFFMGATLRTLSNYNGVTRDAGNVYRIYAEDWNEVVAKVSAGTDTCNASDFKVAGTSVIDASRVINFAEGTIGDGTNYTEFESDGTIVLHGDATVWKDLNIAGPQFDLGSTAPTADEFKDGDGDDTGVETLSFAVNDFVSDTIEIPHDYKEGSDFYFHVHYQGLTAPGGGTDNVKWTFTYIVFCDGEVPKTAVSTASVEGAFTTQYNLETLQTSAITGSTAGCDGGNLEIGDQIGFQLKRVSASSDDYAGGALIATAGIHYEVDTIGSRGITSK